ncbi:alpha/beta hydrolase [Cupriavidus pauculus]|uniref:Alpha/beta hydrolase n=1 Tax=Cupriavidus pauculus TaxID=82633 RepID=A0A5P2HE00_9BURK|nr:alpha/beta hydrolase [Cupriavidus pauculus]QET06048.1 alpha/beta hydrolase [Cupriavidus pauculus]
MTTWIFLRGLTREARHWGTLPALWESHGLGRPVTIDLPGNGAQRGVPVPATVGGIREHVRAAARQAMLPPHTAPYKAPYRVLAMSLGAMVATDWAQQYPDEIAGLVLVNTSLRPFSGVTERLRPDTWAALLGMARHWDDRVRCERTIHRLTCERLDTRDADLAEWVAIARSAPVPRRAAWQQLMAAARYQAQPARPACPTLLLSSAADRLVNPICTRQLEAAWQVAHRQHPWAGHDLPHDDPHWVCERVARFSQQ